MQGRNFLLLLSFWTENILKLKKDQEVFVCINIYPSLSNLPRSSNFLNSKNQPFHATQDELKASVFLFEHARLHGKDPVPTVHPGRVSEDSVHTAARLSAFRVPHSREPRPTVMERITVRVQLREGRKDKCFAFTEQSRHPGKEVEDGSVTR